MTVNMYACVTHCDFNVHVSLPVNTAVETASTLLYAQETTTAQLRSQFCFPDRLVILNEDRMFSNDYVKIFCRNTRKFSDCRAFSFLRPLPAAGHIATAPDNSVAYSAADVL